jgi:hypothetical protein
MVFQLRRWFETFAPAGIPYKGERTHTTVHPGAVMTINFLRQFTES